MAARLISVAASRGIFTSAPVQLGLKETSTYDTFASERHKQDSLAKRKCGRGHWKPELASDSEEAVRADRAVVEGEAGVKLDNAIRMLQEKTKSTAEETAKAGTSMEMVTPEMVKSKPTDGDGVGAYSQKRNNHPSTRGAKNSARARKRTK